jgi:hypothetical protein
MKNTKWIAKSTALPLVLLSACTLPDTPLGGAVPAAAQRPLGAADGAGDTADGACKVVLRSVSRIKNGPGYATTCDLGINAGTSCLYVWEGQIDVDPALSSATVDVLFRTGQTGGKWYAVEAKPEPAQQNGFARFSFRLTEFTPAAGMSLTSLGKTVIELIPYVKTAQGGRLFDHNRVADPLGSYRLDLDNMWTIDNDSAVCAPAAGVPEYVLDYPGFGETLVGGPAQAGGKLKISYDGRRLRETQSCMGSKGPSSATTLYVGYMFDNDGSTAQKAGVESYLEMYGNACQGPTTPCITHDKMQPMIDLPAGASSIQMWFYCVPGFSSGSPGNWKYDSNLGQNYSLALSKTGQSGASIDWAGNWRLHAARSGFTFPLPVSYEYTGFTNMGWSAQAEVYVKGLTDKPTPDGAVRAYVESDMIQCAPGGAKQKAELSLAEAHAGPFKNNSLYRWGFEGLINNCPKGTYSYRFLFSADGGKTVTPLGAAASTDDPGAAGWRTIVFK